MRLKEIEILMQRCSMEEIREQLNNFMFIYHQLKRQHIPIQLQGDLNYICGLFHQRYKNVVEDEKKLDFQDEENLNQDLELPLEVRIEADRVRLKRLEDFYLASIKYFTLIRRKDYYLRLSLRFLVYKYESEIVNKENYTQNFK